MPEKTMTSQEYPLFDSIVSHVRKSLEKSQVTHFKRWNNDIINATGLEIKASLGTNGSVKYVTINFDWDRFKEIGLAQQLEMNDHPLIVQAKKDEKTIKAAVPSIEIEVIWNISPNETGGITEDLLGDQRLRNASKWMQKISHNVNTLLMVDHVISRWHIDIEGDMHGRYISDAMLMAYFNYDLSHLQSSSEVDAFIRGRINYLIYKTSKVIKISEQIIKELAA